MGGPAEAKLRFSPAELDEIVQNYNKEKQKHLLASKHRKDPKGVFSLKAVADRSTEDETSAAVLLAPLLKAEQSHLVRHTLRLIVKKMFGDNIIAGYTLKDFDYDNLINILSLLNKKQLLTDKLIGLLPQLIQPIPKEDESYNEHEPIAYLKETLHGLSKYGLLTEDNLSKVAELEGKRRQYFTQVLMNHTISARHHRLVPLDDETRALMQFDAKTQVQTFIDETQPLLKDCPEAALPLFLQKMKLELFCVFPGRLFSWDNVTTTSAAYYRMYRLLNQDDALMQNDNEQLNSLLENKKLFWQLSRAWPHCFNFSNDTREHFWALFNVLKSKYSTWSSNLYANMPSIINAAIMLYQSNLLTDKRIDAIYTQQENLRNKDNPHTYFVRDALLKAISILSETNLLTEDNLNKLIDSSNTWLFEEKYSCLLWEEIPSAIPHAALDQAFLDTIFDYNPGDRNNKTKPFKRLIANQRKKYKKEQALLKKENKQIYQEYKLNTLEHSAKYTHERWAPLKKGFIWSGTPLIRLLQGLGVTISTIIAMPFNALAGLFLALKETDFHLSSFILGPIVGVFMTPVIMYEKLKDTSDNVPPPVLTNKEASEEEIFHGIQLKKRHIDLPANDAHIKLYLRHQSQKQKRHLSSVIPKFLHKYVPARTKETPNTGAIDNRFYGTKLEISSSYRQLLDDFNSFEQSTKEQAVKRLKAIVERKTTAKTDKFGILSSKLFEEMKVSTAANDHSSKMATLETEYNKLDKPKRKALSALFKETKRQHLKLRTLDSLSASLQRPGLSG